MIVSNAAGRGAYIRTYDSSWARRCQAHDKESQKKKERRIERRIMGGTEETWQLHN